MSTTTLQDLATEAADWLETRTRDSGAEFVCVQDGAAGWVGELMQAAHETEAGRMLPDDWRYRMTSQALDALADHEDADEARDSIEPSIYHHERCDWLASHGWRPGYCDDAVSEGLVSEGAGIMDRIGAGQLCEALEVFEAVRSFLEERAEEIEEEAEDAADELDGDD